MIEISSSKSALQVGKRPRAIMSNLNIRCNVDEGTCSASNSPHPLKSKKKKSNPKRYYHYKIAI